MFLLRSIHQLRPALESLKDEKYEDVDKTDAKFKSMIPSQLTFQMYYTRPSLYAIDASQTKTAYNEFAYNESNIKPNKGIGSKFYSKK